MGEFEYFWINLRPALVMCQNLKRTVSSVAVWNHIHILRWSAEGIGIIVLLIIMPFIFLKSEKSPIL